MTERLNNQYSKECAPFRAGKHTQTFSSENDIFLYVKESGSVGYCSASSDIILDVTYNDAAIPLWGPRK